MLALRLLANLLLLATMALMALLALLALLPLLSLRLNVFKILMSRGATKPFMEL